jgi:hypothetical protein
VSHAANNYVKKLKSAPGGEVITTTERALLWYLADGHNEEQGNFHFAGVATLAQHCGVGQRQMRRIIGSIEDKGIVARVYARRPNGSHTVNRYVFPALGYVCPACDAAVAPAEKHECVETEKAKRKQTAAASKGINTRKKGDDSTCVKAKESGGKRTKNGAKAEDKPVDVTGEVGSPTTVHPGHPVQEGGVAHDSTLGSPTTSLATNLSTGSSTDLSTETAKAGGDGDISPETTSKTKTARANVLPTPPDPPHPGKWDAFKTELLRKLEQLPEKISVGYVDEFNATIRDTSLIDDSCDGDSMVPTWTISAIDPDATRSTLAALANYVKAALWKTAKGNVQVQVYGGEQ